MVEDVSVRPFEDGDYVAFTRLVCEAWPDGPISSSGLSLEGEVSAAQALARSDAGFVAVAGDAVVGVCVGGAAGFANERWARARARALSEAAALGLADRYQGDAQEYAVADKYIADGGAGQAEVNFLVVSPAWRGLGIGGALLARLLRAFAERGIGTFFLMTDDGCDWGLYEHLGMHREREERHGEMEIYLYEGEVAPVLERLGIMGA